MYHRVKNIIPDSKHQELILHLDKHPVLLVMKFSIQQIIMSIDFCQKINKYKHLYVY